MASKTMRIAKLVSAFGCLFVSVLVFRKRVRIYEIVLSDLWFENRKKQESNYLGEM